MVFISHIHTSHTKSGLLIGYITVKRIVLFSLLLHIITWKTLTLYFMLFSLLSFVRWPSPKRTDWFHNSFLWLSEYHFVKGDLIFITCFWQMKWLQMCYMQTLDANKVHFLQEGKAHTISHFLFNDMRAWAAYSGKGRERCKANHFISGKFRVLQLKTEAKGYEKTAIFQTSNFLFFPFQSSLLN